MMFTTEQKEYYKKLTYNTIATMLGVMGFILLYEHESVWGYIDLTDFVGHEIYGLMMILIGFIMFLYKSKQVQDILNGD